MSFVRHEVRVTSTIKEIADQESVVFQRGCGFYELTKREKISASKALLLYKKGFFFSDDSAIVRQTCGVSTSGDVSISSADIPNGFTLYVQSTSPNRKVSIGESVVFKVQAGPAVVASSTVSKISGKRALNSGSDDDEDVPPKAPSKRSRNATSLGWVCSSCAYSNSDISADLCRRCFQSRSNPVSPTSPAPIAASAPSVILTTPLPLAVPPPPAAPILVPLPYIAPLPLLPIPVPSGAPVPSGGAIRVLPCPAYDPALVKDEGNGWKILYNTLNDKRVPSVLFKLSSPPRDVTEVLAFDMDSTIIITKSGTVNFLSFFPSSD
jgi:hypothetical protein